MATFARILAPALIALLAGPVASAAAPAAFHVPIPVERTLPNGLRVVVFADHRLPIVEMQLLIPAGSAQDPDSAIGAASLVAQLLRSGTSSRTAAVLTAEVDRLGGSLSSSVARDYSTVSATFLAGDLDAGLELLADATVNSIFPAEEVDRLRRQLAPRLAQVQQNPSTMADARLWEAVFGSHPYARSPLGSPATLARLEWSDLRAFHGDFYRPDRAVLAIAGDVDPERAFAAAADRFGDWAGHTKVASAPAVPAPPAAPRLRVVDRPDLGRSEVRIGLLCPPQTDPDAVALQIAERVFAGGGSGSRLGRALAGSGLSPADLRTSFTILGDAGLLSVGGPIMTDSVAVFVARVRDELARLATHPPEAGEVDAARRTLAGGFALQFQSPSALLAQWSGAEAAGLDAAWLDRYGAEVATVPLERVVRAAARWLDPEHVVVVAVGPAATLVPALQSLGVVEVVGGPEARRATSAAAIAPPDAQQLRRGRQLLDQAVLVHGGLPRLRRVKDSSIEGTMIMQLGQLGGNDAELGLLTMRKQPDRMRYSTTMGGVESGQILNGDHGWVYVGAGDSLSVTPADSVGLLGMRLAFASDVVHTLLAACDPAAQVVAVGTSTADGREADVLEVTRASAGAPPTRSRLHLDRATHRLVAQDIAEDPEHPGSFLVRRVYRDYRAVNGVEWPFYEERLRSGTKTMAIVLKSVRVDSGLSDALFEEPRLPQHNRPLR